MKNVRVTPSEAKTVQEIRLALGHLVRLDKNPVGSYETEEGARIAYGLGVGSPDLVGSIRLFFACLGGALPLVFQLEVKKPGRRNENNRGLSDDQVKWQKMIRAEGGWCDVVDCVGEALDSVSRCMDFYGAQRIVPPGRDLFLTPARHL